VIGAKYLNVALIAAAAALMNLGAMTMALSIGLRGDSEVSARFSLSAGQLLTLLACLLPSAFMASGVSLAVASLARSFKEAQSFLTPVTLVATVPGVLAMMPGVELNAATAAVPLLNLALLVKATILGAAQPLHVAIASLSVLLYSALAVVLASRTFQSERLRLGGAESWADLFRLGRRST
jgi:sodium transport system permease protein